MKIIVYESNLEADCKLKPFFYDNALTAIKVARRLTTLAEKVMLPRRKDYMQEFIEGVKLIGKGKRMTAPIRLFKSEQGYAFEINYFSLQSEQEPMVFEGFFNSPQDLAEVVCNNVVQLPFSCVETKEKSFLYTVRELYQFSKKEKAKIRELRDYNNLPTAQKSELEAVLKKYSEHGLNLEERKDFLKVYRL